MKIKKGVAVVMQKDTAEEILNTLSLLKPAYGYVFFNNITAADGKWIVDLFLSNYSIGELADTIQSPALPYVGTLGGTPEKLLGNLDFLRKNHRHIIITDVEKEDEKWNIGLYVSDVLTPTKSTIELFKEKERSA